MRDRVFGALDNLPPDIDPPEVSKADADARPILMLWVRSDRRTLLDLSRLADETFAERFQTIDGVSRVDIWGDKTPAMRLWLDPQRLAATACRRSTCATPWRARTSSCRRGASRASR